jgi:hypothetical protein
VSYCIHIAGLLQFQYSGYVVYDCQQIIRPDFESRRPGKERDGASAERKVML